MLESKWCEIPCCSAGVILLVTIGRPWYICIASPFMISPLKRRASPTASCERSVSEYLDDRTGDWEVDAYVPAISRFL